MNNQKSIFFIIIGTVITIIAILNFLFDIPDLIATYRLEQILTLKQANFDQVEPDIFKNPEEADKSAIIPGEPTAIEESPKMFVTPLPTLAPSVPVEVITGYVPDKIIIPAIRLDAPVIRSTYGAVELRDQWFEQWIVPDEFAAGWQGNSAPLGMTGNTVIGGHHNEYGKVFGHLVELEIGDTIYVYSGNVTFVYKVVDKQLLKEKDVSLDIRRANAEWISPTDDERLTLVTCWPKRSNTHRVIIVAEPVVVSESG